MKSGMIGLVILLTSLMAESSVGEFRSMIHNAEQQQYDQHQLILRNLRMQPRQTFYQADWLSLRRRKKYSIAGIKIKLHKQQHRPNHLAIR